MDKIRVLIIEDDLRVAEINRKFTERIEGYEVCGLASTIHEAKEALPILEPDLVLLDIYFPDGYGVDILWHIRNYHRSTDVILITAAKEINTVQEAIRGGVIDYIIKPIMFDRFKKTLVKYLEYRRHIATIDDLNQQEVDHLFQAVRKEKTNDQEIPKGIDPLTLKKISEEISNCFEEGVTAEELGQYVGVSRTTARRYLEYMVSIGSTYAELAYGHVGRPERRYYSKKG